MMVKMLHIIQNDPDVPPGLITEYLTVPYQLHHLYRDGVLPATGAISGLIVLGGRMGADDDRDYPFLTALKECIRQVVSAGIPYLGICLGGQLLASALGACVVSGRWEEVGNCHATLSKEGQIDPLFKGLPSRFRVFQWHHDSFDLPEKSVLLASSPDCPHQAFRVGGSAWGVQFHPEVTEQIIRCWSAWTQPLPDRVEKLVADFNAEADNYHAVTENMLQQFMACMIP